jgi:competence/damage-inducible protein CinA C-terminal domain
MNVEIITIGDELLIGQVVDTNSAWMGQQLESEGFHVIRKVTVGDIEEDMLAAIDSAMNRAEVVLVTGGIGPTKDDITRKTLCKYFDSQLHFSDEVYQNIENIFNRNGRAMNELTRDQAMVPNKAIVIQNRAGTAPSTWFERNGKVLVSMPGVPYEMKWLISNEILPRLKKQFRQDIHILHHTTWVNGFSESMLAIHLEAFENALPPNVKLAYLPQPGLIRLRLTIHADTRNEAQAMLAGQQQKLRDLLQGHILTEEDKAPDELIGAILKEKQLTLGTAESCTGGKIASIITSTPGCSAYFSGSIVSYSNKVKEKVLGVNPEDIEKHGAVSREVVEQMALGAIRQLGCDCSVATSGIAGPDGGTPDKPVGTVWIAAAIGSEVVSECYQFSSIREQNILRSSNMALLMLLNLLKKQN